LESLGYQVTVVVYDELDTFVAKAANKIRHEAPTRLGLRAGNWPRRRATRLVRDRLAEVKPDVVVAIRADTVDPEIWADLAARGVPTVLWLYDELRRTSHNQDSLGAFTGIASYSRLDVAELDKLGFPAMHLPLAFDPEVPHPRVVSPGVVFVGARYPNRETALVGLCEAGVPASAHGRDWSTHPFDRIRTWNWARPDVPSGRDVSRAEAYALMAGADAVLNVHGDQDGFTMRTFEAAGVGSLQLIDRGDIDEHFDPQAEVAVFRSTEELIELARRAMVDRSWARRVGENAAVRARAEHTFAHRMQALEQLWV
jgi:spore maturation protein CgeB